MKANSNFEVWCLLNPRKHSGDPGNVGAQSGDPESGDFKYIWMPVFTGMTVKRRMTF